MRDNIDTDYLILISSDGKKNGYEIYKDRISENMWPIYHKTPQQNNIIKGKKVIFYIAGKDEYAQNFISSAEIDEIIENKHLVSDPNKEFSQIISFIKFKDHKIFKSPINIKNHIKNLSFIDPDRRQIYGLYFQGGVCKINQQSYEYIINSSN